MAAALNNLAAAVADQGRWEEAERLHRKALAMRRALLGAEAPAVARSLYGLAGVLMARHRAAEAEPLLLESHRILPRSSGSTHPHTVQTTARLVQLYESSGIPSEATRFRRLLPAPAP